MPAPEVDRVTLQETDLLFGEDHGVTLCVLLQSHQALAACLDVVAEPDTANAARAHFSARQAQLVQDALRSVSWDAQG